MAFVDYIESQLGEPKYNLAHTEAHWCCPFCTDTRFRFRFNSNKLAGLCFNCDWRGNAVKFVKDFNRLTNWSEAFDIVNFYQDFQPLPQDIYEEVFDRLFMEGQEVNFEKKALALPSDFKLLSETASIQADVYWKYAKKRLLTDRQIATHGVGFCPEGAFRIGGKDGKTMFLKGRLVVQTFDDNNNPIYWVARDIYGDMKPKVLNPAGGIGTINKSDVVFNLNNAKKLGYAVVTEGMFDATTVGEAGVCLFGKTISVRQLLLLINAGLEAIYVMLDPDALEGAIKLADLFNKHFPEVYLCHLKGGDPNEVGRKGVLTALKEAERYNALTALKYRF